MHFNAYVYFLLTHLLTDIHDIIIVRLWLLTTTNVLRLADGAKCPSNPSHYKFHVCNKSWRRKSTTKAHVIPKGAFCISKMRNEKSKKHSSSLYPSGIIYQYKSIIQLLIPLPLHAIHLRILESRLRYFQKHGASRSRRKVIRWQLLHG